MFLYKLATIFFLFICCCPLVYAQSDYGNTIIYIVRHAEKDTGNNPTLTAGGRIRAGDLMRYLKKEKINHIYSTPYKRTTMTGDSIRINMAVDTLHYPPKPSPEQLYALLKANNDFGKMVLFIGHSNTLPLLIKNFGVTDYPQTDLPDDAFDDIFIIHFKKGKPTVKHKKYGKPSGPSAGMQKMN